MGFNKKLSALTLFCLGIGFSVLLHRSLNAPTLSIEDQSEMVSPSYLAEQLPSSKKTLESVVYSYLSRQLKDADAQKTRRIARLVLQLSKKYQFSPGLILSIVRVESNFQGWVVSPVGAIGLMQIMPETGEWIAKKLKMSWTGPTMLFDEETNLKMGVFYLSLLRAKYSGDLRKMLSAYNRGPAKVDQDEENGIEYSTHYYEKVKQNFPKLVQINPRFAQL